MLLLENLGGLFFTYLRTQDSAEKIQDAEPYEEIY